MKHLVRWAQGEVSDALSVDFACQGTKVKEKVSGTSEVLRSIGQHLVSDYIVRKTESLLRMTFVHTFVLKGQVKVTFTWFQGWRYVASVSNGQEQPDSSSELYALGLGHPAQVVYFAENHLRVSKMVVTSVDHALKVEEVSGVWWRAVHIPCGSCSIMATNDGVKLRGLPPANSCAFCGASREHRYHQVAWPFQTHHMTIRWVGEPRSYLARMTPAVLSQSNLGIQLRTNRGREVFVGIVGAIQDLDWELACTPDTENYRFFYDGMSSMGVGGLAFGDPRPPTEDIQAFDPSTTVPPMPDFRYCVEPFFYFSANMKHLAEITV
ncbi:hypothetical protein FBEOM_9118 [Fusarium beomiforme]|uniref:Uncharacterized protein n=1 Tax=Fusarium beomiforme TaxID=44412 RepID=A0A9P5DVH8_9HYPO|nr:hypothetical protein FBEOM_9118 [Fusarium beomiforme]